MPFLVLVLIGVGRAKLVGFVHICFILYYFAEALVRIKYPFQGFCTKIVPVSERYLLYMLSQVLQRLFSMFSVCSSSHKEILFVRWQRWALQDLRQRTVKEYP